jgi:hypothetical protein
LTNTRLAFADHDKAARTPSVAKPSAKSRECELKQNEKKFTEELDKPAAHKLWQINRLNKNYGVGGLLEGRIRCKHPSSIEPIAVCAFHFHRMHEFNQSLKYDKRMYAVDIQGSIAYAKALARRNILTSDELEKMMKGLRAVLEEWETGTVSYCPHIELVN